MMKIQNPSLEELMEAVHKPFRRRHWLRFGLAAGLLPCAHQDSMHLTHCGLIQR
jgi:hypothetical protein